MLKLRGGTATEANANAIFRQLFLDKLPLTIRTALAIHSKEKLENLAEMGDTMAETQGPQAQGLGQATICAVKPAEPTGMAESCPATCFMIMLLNGRGCDVAIA